jgi:phage-related protein
MSWSCYSRTSSTEPGLSSNNLTPDSKPAREAIKQLGISFFDAKGNFVGLRETSERLQNAFAGLTQEQRLATAEAIFGSDAQRAALVLADQGAEGFDKLSASVNKAGAAQKLAGAQTKGITGAIGALSSSLETAAIEFGNLISPVVEPALRGLASALNWFIEGLNNGNPLIQAAAIFIGVLATGLLIAATAFGIATLAGGLFAAIFSPISLIIIGVIAVIAALAAIAFVVVQNWSTISQFFTGLWNGILAGVSGFIGGAVQFFRELPGKIVSGLGNLGSLLLDAGKNLIDGLVKGLGNAKDAVINKIKEICNNSLNEVKKFFGIQSPSKVMAAQGRFIAEGLADGIGQGQGMVDAAIHRLDPQLTPTADLIPQISPDVVSPNSAGRSGAGTNPLEVTQNIYNNVDMDRGLRDLAWRLAN